MSAFDKQDNGPFFAKRRSNDRGIGFNRRSRHKGVFKGNVHAMVECAVALKPIPSLQTWQDAKFMQNTQESSGCIIFVAWFSCLFTRCRFFFLSAFESLVVKQLVRKSWEELDAKFD